MKNKKWMKKGILATSLVGLISIGGAIAYFTDAEEATNQVTVGNVRIDLEEEEWDKVPEEEKQNITPNQTLAKDPKIINTGDNTAFVFLDVSVPVAEVITANEDGSKNPKELTELFSYQTDSNWTQVGKMIEVKDKSDKVIAHKYLYAYGDSTSCTSLAPGSETSELFQSVLFANIIEGQLLPDGSDIEGSTLHIDIHAHAIQTNNLTENKVNSPEEVWKVYSQQNENADGFLKV